MECREHCGACCIAPAIVQPFYGMPAGKPAGERCVHLTPALRCGLFADARRPSACSSFLPEPDFCGSSREEALDILALIEHSTDPVPAAGNYNP